MIVVCSKCLEAHSLYGPRLPSLRLMFRLHLHEEASCMCQHKQCACEAHQRVHLLPSHWRSKYHLVSHPGKVTGMRYCGVSFTTDVVLSLPGLCYYFAFKGQNS